MTGRTTGVLALTLLLAAAGRSVSQDAAKKVDFYRDVRPILSIHCHKCHSADAPKGGLRLDTREHALKGGDSGPAILPGKSGDSILLFLVSSKNKKIRMPSKAEPLAPREIEILRRWIDEGAAWPDAAEIAHWAFKPLVRPALPAVKNAAWVRTPVDAFVAKEHEARGLVAAPEADRRALIRRVTLDLTGLPPAPEDLDRGYEETVDRLLASPAYGERWGRHWLDLVRWAETSGYEANALRSSAWRYRDYAVKSFNEDKPYDAFLRQQIAGDEVQPPSDENLVATGFLAHGRLDLNQEDKVLQRNDHLLDITNMLGTVLFGLSMGCAQCHDHKWDPITQKDYYRLQAFLVRGQVNNVLLRDPAEWAAYEKSVPPELEASKVYRKVLLDAARARLQEEKKVTLTNDQVLKAAGDDDRKLFAELDKKIKSLEEKMPEKPHAWGFYSPATGDPDVKTMPIKGQYTMPYDPAKLKTAKGHVLKRGDCHQIGEEVSPGWPAVLGETPKDATTRLALAEWLTRADHPTVARMFVNFVWQRHFGRAIVPTPADFGLRGERPTHPGLLDWLSSEFIAGGWSVKALHRAIVLSATYRQSSAVSAAADRENRWLARWSPRRLEAEAIRDSILAASGELDRTIGGKSVAGEDPKQSRRTLYLLQKRSHLPEIQELFDAPTAGESCPMRHVSTVSLQPLYLMNSPFVHGRAQVFARRLSAEAPSQGAKAEAELRAKAFEIALSRPPTPAELDAAAGLDLPSLCHALFNLNEFVYVE